MQIAAAITLIVIWLIILAIQGIDEGIADYKRRSRLQATVKKSMLLAEQKARFESYKKPFINEYKSKLKEWEKLVKDELATENDSLEEKHKNELIDIEQKNQVILREWEAQKEELNAQWKKSVIKEKQEHTAIKLRIKELRQDYLKGNKASVVGYCNVVLASQQFNMGFPDKHECDYIADNKTLVVNYALPEPADLPTLKEIKYIKSKQALKESHISQSAINKLYDEVIYQLILANVMTLFSADEANVIGSIAFNGWVETVDKAIGHETRACIASLHVSKADLQSINLKNVDPKECFKRMKGVGSSQLYGITPIPPIMKINTHDKRFIESYDVANTLDDSINIAAMNWEDFEHLVREIFEKKFSKDGIEVRVTQSSRDKGVDAIALDPDPLRGGRIVIQAKRYTNVVGVSAVRDLFGTVMNEGATKGILVTTSNFGHDAYDFAKGKPLTLISGGELLTILADCGYKAKIDLKEAKRILAEKEKNK